MHYHTLPYNTLQYPTLPTLEVPYLTYPTYLSTLNFLHRAQALPKSQFSTILYKEHLPRLPAPCFPPLLLRFLSWAKKYGRRCDQYSSSYSSHFLSDELTRPSPSHLIWVDSPSKSPQHSRIPTAARPTWPLYLLYPCWVYTSSLEDFISCFRLHFFITPDKTKKKKKKIKSIVWSRATASKLQHGGKNGAL